MTVIIDTIDSDDLFDDDDKKIIDAINRENLTAREKWSHTSFLSVYKKIKVKLLIKQKRACFYCQRKQTDSTMGDWHIDHIVSIDEDDRHTFQHLNLILTCDKCNNQKNDKRVLNKKLPSAKYSRSSSNYKIVHARLDSYSTHIDKMATLYAGKTPKGRQTIYDCNLDRFKLEFFANIEPDERDLTEGMMDLIMNRGVKKLVKFIKDLDEKVKIEAEPDSQ